MSLFRESSWIKITASCVPYVSTRFTWWKQSNEYSDIIKNGHIDDDAIQTKSAKFKRGHFYESGALTDQRGESVPNKTMRLIFITFRS